MGWVTEAAQMLAIPANMVLMMSLSDWGDGDGPALVFYLSVDIDLILINLQSFITFTYYQ